MAEMKRTLTLTGVTVNAMAFIAPGAFLWTTFQLQAAQTAGGVTTAFDMVTGLLFVLAEQRAGELPRKHLRAGRAVDEVMFCGQARQDRGRRLACAAGRNLP